MKSFFTLILIFSLSVLHGEVSLPKIFSDNMILQRDVLIPIWGWAKPYEKIEVKFNHQTKITTANEKGTWFLKLDKEKAGGPFEIEIKGENEISIKNILVGEVWLCSGQSNMEWIVKNSQNADHEIKNANNPNIRHFKIEKALSTTPKLDISSGKWEVCNPTTVQDFSAVGYYFALKLYQKLNIPIGIINSSWGGTNIETWISREGFENNAEFKDLINSYESKTIDLLIKTKIERETRKINQIQKVPLESFNVKNFLQIDFDDSKLPTLHLPQAWEQQSLGDIDGTVWIRKTFEITEEQSNKPAIVFLNKVDDEDITYVNGVEIGTTSIWDQDRKYMIPKGILHKGKNVLVVKIIDYGGGGGIWDANGELNIQIVDEDIPLAGEWKFQVEKILTAENPNDYPTLCYNAMIAPINPYSIKGVLWYQGESNAERAFQYRNSFPLLIKDWRKKWAIDFPFYFVQLATFDTKDNSNIGSPWAELREAQCLTLKLPNTGMVVTTDIGDPKDIHPRDKQTVGHRLANLALNNLYYSPTICNSPTFDFMTIKGSTAIINFKLYGSSLISKRKLKGFEIAGEDHFFHPADAELKENKVIVSSEKISNPIAVRFGWKGDDTECNLFNAAGLPVVPFRTDNWEAATQNMKYVIRK